MAEIKKRKLFFTLWPDDATRRKLQGLAAAYPAGGIPMAAENLHLTLVFVGYVDGQIQACLEAAATGVRMPAFDITIDCIDHFGQKIHWAGSSHPPTVLFDLQRTLEEACEQQCGYQPEARSYRPHITLERKPRQALSSLIDEPFVWHIKSFSLVESIASNEEGQPPAYKPLRHWPLIEDE